MSFLWRVANVKNICKCGMHGCLGWGIGEGSEFMPDGAGRGTNYNKAGMRCEKREENGRETAWPQGNTACRGCVGR